MGWQCLGRHLLPGGMFLLTMLCFQGISREGKPRTYSTPAAPASLHFGTMMELPIERVHPGKLTAGSPTNHPIEIRKSHLNQTSILEFHLILGGAFNSFVCSPQPREIIQFDQYISNGLKASKESKKGAVQKKLKTTHPKTNKSPLKMLVFHVNLPGCSVWGGYEGPFAICHSKTSLFLTGILKPKKGIRRSFRSVVRSHHKLKYIHVQFMIDIYLLWTYPNRFTEKQKCVHVVFNILIYFHTKKGYGSTTPNRRLLQKRI